MPVRVGSGRDKSLDEGDMVGIVRFGRRKGKFFSAFIAVGIRDCRAHNETVHNLLGVMGEDLKCEGVFNVFGEANERSEAFFEIAGERVIVEVREVHGFEPLKGKDRRDIDRLTGQTFKRGYAITTIENDVIKCMAHMHKAKEPEGRGCVCAIHENVGDALDVLITTFSRVLVLVIGLGLPFANVTIATDVLDLFTREIRGRVRDKSSGSATLDYHVLKDTRKFLDETHADNVTDFENRSRKELGSLNFTVDGWRVEGECVCE